MRREAARKSSMSPPCWVDEQRPPAADAACPTCGREIPVNRWPGSTLRTQGWRPYSLLTWGRMVRASAGGRAGARGGRLVLGDPRAGRGA